MRQEHRTLPVLIALGVLLGAGLAIATPAGHHASERRPTPGVGRSPSPSATAATSSAPTPTDGASTPAEPATCGHGPSSPGWAAGQPPLAHAIHVLSSSCHGGHGPGLQTAIQHIGRSAGRQTGTTTAGGSSSTGHRHATGTQDQGRGGHTPQTGHAGGPTASVQGSDGTVGPNGVNIINGKGRDGLHGNDIRTAGSSAAPGSGSSGSDGSAAPSVRGSSADHGAGTGRRPGVPSGPAR
jgi:hypothetical protein